MILEREILETLVTGDSTWGQIKSVAALALWADDAIYVATGGAPDDAAPVRLTMIGLSRLRILRAREATEDHWRCDPCGAWNRPDKRRCTLCFRPRD